MSDNLKKISVIVPAYNAEKYIERCVNSLIEQTHNNLEIIIINDGSTDATSEICASLTKKDSRINYIESPNSGVAHARNLGIMHSTGDYICFVDADDYLQNDCLEYQYDRLVSYSSDIMICNYQKKYENQTDKDQSPKINDNPVVMSGEEALADMLYRKKITSAPWCKLVRADIVKNNPFPENILFEDLACVYLWLSKANRICYGEYKGYTYIQRKGSAQHQDFNPKTIDQLKAAYSIRKYLTNKHPSIISAGDNRIFVSALAVLKRIPLSSNVPERKLVLRSIRETRGIVLHDKAAKKSTRMLALLSYFSIHGIHFLGRIQDRLLFLLKISLSY